MLMKNTRSSLLESQTGSYRPEIDGLRAVAVLPVILFHAGMPYFSGGFIGVDIFFVISGFLITTIIARDIEAGQFSVVGFYERRARRILPALFVMMLVCLPFAWLWMLPNALKDFSQSLMATVAYGSNILFYIETGYFDLTSAQKPLLHTWSLSVEEQFYLVFPLLLIGILRFGRRQAVALLVLLALASFACAQWLLSHDPEAGFYMIFSRAWELVLGATGAFAAMGQRRSTPVGYGDVLALIGLLAIVASMAFFPAAARTPGLSVLPCVLGTVLVLVYARQGSIAGRLLSARPLVWVGLISYSAYLWHQPLLAFLHVRSLNEPAVVVSVAVALLSLPIAALSWRFVERPFRDRRMVSRRAIFGGAIAGSAMLFAIGAMGQMSQGFPGRLPAQAQQVVAIFNDQGGAFRPCLGTENNYLPPQRTCRHHPELPETVMLYGDSHGAALAAEIAKIFATQKAGMRQFTHSGCTPSAGLESSVPGESCARFNADALDYLDSHPGIDTVVLVARWTTQLEGTLFDNREGGNEGHVERHMVPLHAGAEFADQSGRIAAVAGTVRMHIRSLLAKGKKVILVYQIPEAGWDVPVYLAKEMQFGIRRTSDLSTSAQVNKLRNSRSDQMLDGVGLDPNLIRIRPSKLFCGTEQPGRCLLQASGSPLYIDDDHVSQLGASMIAAQIAATMPAVEPEKHARNH